MGVACRWVQYNTVIPCHLVQEQYLAHSIFGVTLGSQAFLDIVLPKAPEEDRFASKRFTTTLLDWKRIPEKASTPALASHGADLHL